jgi:hypothetical protein
MLGKHGSTILVAFVTSAIFAGGPAIAAIVANAHRVDGKHAVGSSATPAARAGKLVATNGSGKLPNNIIAKAIDADKLDGLDSTAYLGDTVTLVQGFTNISSNDFGTGTVMCPAGYTATGGGVDPDGLLQLAVSATGPWIDGTRPLSASNGQHGGSSGWFGAVARTAGSGDFVFKVVVICAKS